MISQHILKKAQKIRFVISDVDGTLTDGRISIDSDGIEHKFFHVHDGLGLVLLKRAGIEVAIISGHESPQTIRRMEMLGITHVYQGVQDKSAMYTKLLAQFKLTHEEIACIGDDLPDIPIMKQAGLGIAVANATSAVRLAADWCTHKNGGDGAVREVCDLLLASREKNYV